MLGFITSDGSISGKALKMALKETMALTFNQIANDGDISPNDTVQALSSGTLTNAPSAPLDS